jgi:hypothetical protein
MAAQYTEISLEDMEKFLKRAFRAFRPKQSSKSGEFVYDLTIGKFVGIRVWTSVGVHSGSGASVGSDAIRVQLISLKDHGPLEKGKAPIVKRTQGWRTSLQDRIEELVEKYEEKEDFWEPWAETRQRRGDPEKVMQQEERPEVNPEDHVVNTPVPQSTTYQRTVPLERLHGDISPKQVGFIRGLLRNVTHHEWERLGLANITHIDSIPTDDQLRSLSKRQGSQVIETLLNAGHGRKYAADELKELEIA